MYLDTIPSGMRRQTLLTLLTAAMLVLAGCAGSTGGDGSPTTDGTTTPDAEPDDSDTDSGDTTATGTVQFYVSDDPGQIDDFRHLNVTISQIGFERAGGGEEMDDEGMENESEEETETPENETETPENETETPENETETPEDTDDETTTEPVTTTTTEPVTTTTDTTTDGGVAVAPQTDNHENETESDEGMDGNETEMPDDMDGNETESDDEMDGNDSDEDGEMEEDEDGETEGDEGDDSESRDGWVTHDVDSRTVDLTQLKGDNATLIDSPELPAGNYSKVFVYVSDINATLTDGSSVNVKLPSNKLQLNKGFTLEPNGTVSFVYDITVFKAGNSGKYILKPVISESGPDKRVDDVDDRSDEREGDEEQEEDDEEDADTSEPKVGTQETRGPPEDRGKN